MFATQYCTSAAPARTSACFRGLVPANRLCSRRQSSTPLDRLSARVLGSILLCVFAAPKNVNSISSAEFSHSDLASLSRTPHRTAVESHRIASHRIASHTPSRERADEHTSGSGGLLFDV